MEGVVRPEAVTRAPASGKESNFRIGDIRVRGRDWLVLLMSESFGALEPLRARVPALDGLAVDASVAVRFDPAGTFAFSA